MANWVLINCARNVKLNVDEERLWSSRDFQVSHIHISRLYTSVDQRLFYSIEISIESKRKRRISRNIQDLINRANIVWKIVNHKYEKVSCK